MNTFPENKPKHVRLLLLLLLLALWQPVTFASPRNVSVTPEPAWIKKLPTRTQTSISPGDVNGGFHYLQMSIQFEVARQERYYQYVYKLTTEEGVQNLSELNISFDPHYEQLQLHQVVVWRNGEPINQLDLDRVKVLQREQGMEQGIYDESLTAVLVLEDVRVGDVVAYSFTIKGGNPVFGGKFFSSFNLQGYDPMDELLVRLVAPQDRTIHYKLYRTDKKPGVATANGHTTYTWHLKDLPATPVDDETPSWFDPYPGVYLSEYSSWEEVAQWALPLYEGHEKPGKALQAKIDSISSAYGSDEARLEAALRFVQDEVRYLGFEAGIGGFKPRSPSAVYAQRFGDCKDKALLLCTMLRQMNIRASPALVNSTSAHIHNQLPSPQAFNHCIVRVELLGGQAYWYDATISKQRGDYKSIHLPNYGKALVIAPHTKDLADVAPPATDEPHVSAQEIYYMDGTESPVTLEVRTAYTGSEADYQRSYFATTSLKDIEKSYLNFYASQYPEIEKAADLAFEDMEASNTFTVIEKYSISNFWAEQEENGEVLEAWFSPQVLRGYIRQPKTSKRTMPLALSHPLYIEQKITVLLPESWPIANAEKEIADDAFFFRKTVDYGPGGKELTLHYSYQSHQDYVEAEATAGYLRNQKALLEELSYGLTYNKALAAGAETDFSWAVLLLVLVLTGGFAFGAYKLYFWDPVPAYGNDIWSSRESIGGWLVLPLIGLFFTPVRVLNFLVSNEYFNQKVWDELLNASSNVYSPALVGVSMAELAVNVAFMVYSVLLIFLFIRRRSSVPKLMVIFYTANACFVLSDYMLVRALNLPTASATEGISTIVGALVGAAIWIPYFNLSERVKATFVEQLQPAPVYEEEVEALNEDEQIEA
ncbi:DUF3857 domain-containing protein [Pontibacter russatus]|uniref:DUF3857 domain-containing protein n=1 Tax=Pontibacter russatus TaxID=2694929 RepID=UPI00137B429F|nr:DUF3857 domain-containing protein [Pontibacter russatus]